MATDKIKKTIDDYDVSRIEEQIDKKLKLIDETLNRLEALRVKLENIVNKAENSN